MNTSNNKAWEALKKWLVQYSKIVLPIILAVCVGFTVVVAMHANKRKVEQEESVVVPQEPEEGEEETAAEVPDVPLEQNAVPEINQLFDTYYTAMVEGDTQTMEKLVYYLDAQEILRATETSKYLEAYQGMEVYTKPGPKEGTYIAFVYTDTKFKDYEKPVPGMRVYYVCTNEDGEFYINEDGEEGDDELRYMREIQLQADVVDLNNKTAVAYNDMIAEDGTLANFLVELNEEIDKNVGEALVNAKENGEQESAEGDLASAEGQESAEESTDSTVVTKVKATDVVNVRSSDSETADKLGKAAVGDEFELLEERGNGWSKIKFGDVEAFIKSDFLEPSETADSTQLAAAETEEPEETPEEAPENNSDTPTGTGEKVRVKETVRIRKGASEDSERIATAYMGETFDVIMKQADGWTKINYNGQTAYVKSDYVE